MVSLDPVLERIFDEALRRGASDIHLEPEAGGLRVRWRVAGAMVEGPALGGAIQENVVSKLALMAGLDSSQRLRPLDGAFVLKGVQTRVSIIPALGGQSVVLRLFKNAGALERLGGLGMDAAQVRQAEEALGRLAGLFIIAGPTGSGKTTTFYAALRAIDPAAQKIITVEDPVEQRLSGVCQTPVRGGLTFATALRSILRQAPNVIGVGELRDAESARMAVQAALTGHLVVATLHADGAAGVPARLIDLGVDAAILSEVLSCAVAQRLLQARGTDGRTEARGIFEVWEPSAQARELIKGRSSAAALRECLRGERFATMRERAAALVSRGELTAEAVIGEFIES